MQIGMTVLTEYYKAEIIKDLKELLLVQIYPVFVIKVNNCVYQHCVKFHMLTRQT